jgi:hypothetical protein
VVEHLYQVQGPELNPNTTKKRNKNLKKGKSALDHSQRKNVTKWEHPRQNQVLSVKMKILTVLY